MGLEQTQLGETVNFTEDDLNRSTPFEDVQVGETVTFDDDQLQRSQDVFTPQETQSYYLEAEDRVIEAPPGMQENEITFIDKMENDDASDVSQFFGYNKLFEKTADVVKLPFKGAAATAINLGATGEAGSKLKLADAIKQGFEEDVEGLRLKQARGEKLTGAEARILLRELDDFNNPLAFLFTSPQDILRNKTKQGIKKNDAAVVEPLRLKEERLRNSVQKIRTNADAIIQKRFARPEKGESTLAERILYDFEIGRAHV